MENKNIRTMKMAMALLATVSVGTLAVTATPAQAMQQGAYNIYAQSNYNYCDAMLVAALFRQNTYEGKITIGNKISSGSRSAITSFLSRSRSAGNSCNWDQISHSYEDAVKLGQVWGVGTGQAKTKAASFYTAGRSDVVRSALAANVPPANTGSSPLDLFTQSDFNFCDAKIMGAVFGKGVNAGKTIIGEQIRNGQDRRIGTMLRTSRNRGNSCNWSDTPHSYGDAEKLGRRWGLSVSSAKIRATDLYTKGRSKEVLSALGR